MTLSCMLDARGLADRGDQLRRLAGSLRARTLASRRATFRFEAVAAPEVRRLVADESRCCGFLDFEVAAGDAEVVLTVTAPPGGESAVDLLADALRPSG